MVGAGSAATVGQSIGHAFPASGIRNALVVDALEIMLVMV